MLSFGRAPAWSDSCGVPVLRVYVYTELTYRYSTLRGPPRAAGFFLISLISIDISVVLAAAVSIDTSTVVDDDDGAVAAGSGTAPPVTAFPAQCTVAAVYTVHSAHPGGGGGCQSSLPDQEVVRVHTE